MSDPVETENRKLLVDLKNLQQDVRMYAADNQRLRTGIRHAMESTTDPVCKGHLRELLIPSKP